MTEQFHNLPIEEMRERVQLAERMAKAQGAEPTPTQRAAGILASKPEDLYINISRKTAKRGGVLAGAAALIGTGLLAGAVLFGGGDKSTENTSGVYPTPTPGESGEPTMSPEPTSTQETSGFTPRETDKEHGFQRAKIDLSEFGGPQEFQADRLDYQPSGDENNPKEVPIMSGSIIDGDAFLDKIWTTDSDGLKGSRILNQKEGAVLDSKWGLTVYENFDPKYTDALMRAIEKNQLSGGCGLVDGCDESIAQVYTADGTLVPYTGDMSPSDITKTPSASTGTEECPAPTATPPLCPEPTPTPTPTPVASCPTASKTPEVGCPEDVTDIEHNPDEWNKKGLPVEKYDGPAIFQADGTIFVNGKKIKTYDSNGATAQIYVVDDKVDGKPVKYQYDWIFGDLQQFCPTLPENQIQSQMQEVLDRDIQQTLDRPDVTSVKVTYVNNDGTFTSKTFKE